MHQENPFILPIMVQIMSLASNLLVQDTSLMDTSTALHEFMTLATESRYQYLSDLGTNILNGSDSAASVMLAYNIDSMANTNVDSATGVVMADGSYIDNIVQNYRQYAQLLLNYINDTLSSTDSSNLILLANKCPYVDGAVVYQARSLYSRVFEDYSIFGNTDCDSAMLSGKAAHPLDSLPATQSYKLYPNPNDGKITLLQEVVDNETTQVEIWNATGIDIYKNQLVFKGGKASLHINNAAPGFYLLQIIDDKGLYYSFKFTVN